VDNLVQHLSHRDPGSAWFTETGKSEELRHEGIFAGRKK